MKHTEKPSNPIAFAPQERVYIRSLYGPDDIPGIWVFVRAAYAITDDVMCVVRQLSPLIYPMEEGVAALSRLKREPHVIVSPQAKPPTKPPTTKPPAKPPTKPSISKFGPKGHIQRIA